MASLDDIRQIKSVDKSDMYGLIVNFPEQCAQAYGIGCDFQVPQSYVGAGYKNIVFSGLGGSAIGADLLRSYLTDDIRIPVFVNRDYTLPKFVGKDTLFLACSYSGDTEETLSAYAEAKEKGARIIVISSGGKLEVLAKEDKIPVIYIPKGYPPRTALGYAFFTWLDVLHKLGFISDRSRDVQEAIAGMKELRDGFIGPDIATPKNEAKKIAQEISGKYVFIYSANKHLDSIALRWRGQLAENAKTLSSTHVFPELNHNELVGWEGPKALLKDFYVVILRDESEHPRIAKRIEITKSIIEQGSTKVTEVRSKGKPGASLLSRMFSLVYTGDFASYYLAVLNGIDPTPVDRITFLKRELSKIR
ncbi:MAG: bifunctional phosphoglucose/phosphomannose isomerase [Candidatus Omnitrophica bacterium]|nr:bifunctional phosphoglucose/phosphomannose isomerase [Candidatus Omnitrophota bacterium]